MPALIAGLTVLAWWNRFVLDDAFISFRYAANLAAGNGLVYNPGERVEGYTNFLWTLLMVIPHLLGIDPVPFAQAIGLASFVLSLFLTHRLAFLATESHAEAWVAVLFLGANYTFSAFATGGLETQTHACLLVATFLVLVKSIRNTPLRPRDLMVLSLLMGLTLLIRLDSAVLLSLVVVQVGARLLREDTSWAVKWHKLEALAIPGALLVVPWLAWKVSYYGDLLPNTFYAKVASDTSWQRGARYVFQFYWSYWLLPFVALLVLSINALRRPSNGPLRILVEAVVLWSLYVIWVGGDFMEFRLLVPVLPMVAILIAWVTMAQVNNRIIQLALVLLVLCGSAYHAITFTWNVSLKLESVHVLKERLTKEHWSEIGKILGEVFRGKKDVVIATAGAGAIGYYSRLPTVDVLGLNDRWVGRHGPVVSNHPGHQRRATLRYLREKKMNFVIHGAQAKGPIPATEQGFTADQMLRMWRWLVLFGPEEIPADSQIVLIPSGRGFVIPAWYITRDPEIDEIIRNNNWVTYSMFPSAAKVK